jgi:hypothetical protein
MMHTKKIILVPHDIAQNKRPIDEIIGKLENDLKVIMKNKHSAVDVKLVKYNQVLHRYSKMMQKKHHPFALSVQQEDDATYPDELILKDIPEKRLKNAQLLLKNVRNNPQIRLNNMGEVIIHGNTIHGSNIVDLIHDFSRDSKVRSPAIGADLFAKVLKEANIPLEYIGNKKRLTLLNRWDE